MKNTDDYLNTKIQTQNGITPIKDINIGDYVYNYFNGHKLEVLAIEEFPKEDIFEVKYTDNRINYFTANSPIYLGSDMELLTIEDLMRINRERAFTCLSKIDREKMQSYHIKPFIIDYNSNDIVNPLTPDPYIAGALLIYGDPASYYINLPIDREEANSLFGNKYQLSHAEILDSNVVYFSYNGTPKSQAITWNQFFPIYNFYAKTKRKSDPIIPIEYHRASINDRWQFIRGVFDIGFNHISFPNTIGIAHTQEKYLMEVQKMLWSLGILSRVEYNPNLCNVQDKVFQLYIIGNYINYPGFFYNDHFINKKVYHSYDINDIDFYFKLKIKSVKWHCKAFHKNIILNKSSLIYLNADYLPMVSI